MKNLIFLLAVLLLWSCTDTEQFRVNGIIEGKPTLNLRVGYYADGAYQTQITAAREGEFEFYGSSKQPTLVEIMDYDYRPLARIYASNGETFDIELDQAKPLAARISGNDVTERWSAFLRDNQEALTTSKSKANEVVANYISSHPADVVSTLLLVTQYNAGDAAEADSVMALIDPKARPSALTESFNFILQRLVSEQATDTIAPFRYANKNDSVRIFDPADSPLNLLVFDRGNNFRTDSVVPALSRLAKKKQLKILELDLEPFANTLKGRSDTLPWTVGRMPGGVAAFGIEHLGVPSEPFFIVADSTGAQPLRPRYPAAAAAFINSRAAQ